MNRSLENADGLEFYRGKAKPPRMFYRPFQHVFAQAEAADFR